MSQHDDLTPEQLAIKNNLNFLSLGAGALGALLVGAWVWFAYKASYPILSYVFVLMAGALAFVVVRFGVMTWLASDAQCRQCGRDFAVSRTDTEETFLSATPRKREQETGRSISGPNEGKRLITVTTWTEERYEVIKTYSCCCCGHSYQEKSFKTVEANKNSDQIYRH
jgi:hypothetical protein